MDKGVTSVSVAARSVGIDQALAPSIYKFGQNLLALKAQLVRGIGRWLDQRSVGNEDRFLTGK